MKSVFWEPGLGRTWPWMTISETETVCRIVSKPPLSTGFPDPSALRIGFTEGLVQLGSA